MQQRLKYLLDKRDYLEDTGRLISLKQAKEIATIRAELKKTANETETESKQ